MHLVLNQPLKRLHVRQNGAEKERMLVFGYQNRREIFHLNRVNQIRLVFHIYPQKPHIWEFKRE